MASILPNPSQPGGSCLYVLHIKYSYYSQSATCSPAYHNICDLFKVMTLAKKADKFYFRPSHAPGNKQLAELATHLLTLPACLGGGQAGRQGVPCELGDIYANCLLCASFRINKSRVLYIYTGNVQITPQGLGEVEFSTCSTISLTLPQSPLLWPPPPASRTVLTFFPAFFSSTNYVAKKNLLDVSVAVKTHGRNTKTNKPCRVQS